MAIQEGRTPAQPGFVDLSPVWRACLEQAWQAFRNGSLPIGAAVVDADGAARMAGVGKVVYAARDVWAGAASMAESGALRGLVRDDAGIEPLWDALQGAVRAEEG